MSELLHKNFAKGEAIFLEGDFGDCAYIIEEGRVEISTQRDGKKLRLAHRHAGEIFGEMAIVDNMPRSATVTALEDCKLLVLSATQLQTRVESLDPVLRMVLGVILKRFRESMKTVNTETVAAQQAAPPRSAEQIEHYRGVIERIELEQALRLAIERDELMLHYQPIMSATTGVIDGFEALMRWRRDGHGIVSPGKFIPIAEEYGLMRDMTIWAMREVCGLLTRHSQAPGSRPNFHISFNMAATEASDPTFVEEVRRALEDSGAPADRLSIEITETVLISDPDATIATLEKYRALGAPIGIDDFGTGYSSLSYLTKYPLDYIKIDKSFVDHIASSPRDRDVARTMIELGRILGLKSVAEGVETEDQAAILRELGCDRLQGFLFSKPIPWEEALAPRK